MKNEVRYTACRGAEFCDLGAETKDSPSYREGIRKLREWHRQCAIKRGEIKPCKRGRKDYGASLSKLQPVTINGETKTLGEWCEEYGVSFDTVRYRMTKGMSAAEAITKPTNRNLSRADRNAQLYVINGVQKTLAEWCKDYCVNYSTLITRIHTRGMSLVEALTTPVVKGRPAKMEVAK